MADPSEINSGSLNLSAPGTTITGDLNVANGAGIDMHLSDIGDVPTEAEWQNLIPHSDDVMLDGVSLNVNAMTLACASAACR